MEKQEEEFCKEEFNDKSKIEAIAKSWFTTTMLRNKENSLAKGCFHILVNDIIWVSKRIEVAKRIHWKLYI